MRLKVIPTGKTTATVIMTQDQVDELRGSPGRGRVPVAIRYGGQTFRTSVSVYRGEWMMVVNAEMRGGGLAPGSTYDVEITADTEERTVEVPADLAQALKAAGVQKAFNALAYLHRKEHVRSVEDAKKPETRARRIAKVVEALSSN
jgi:hypothetical protein